jgi:hypothetical protein
MRHRTRLSVVIIAIAAMLASCGSKARAFEEATLIEGRGLEAGLVVGATTLSQARGFLGKAAGETSTSGDETVMTAGPFRLIFLPPETGGEAVLHAIRTARVANPQFPRWKGRSSRGIGFLDPEEKVRAAYGPPAVEWRRSFGGTAFYYTTGLVLVLEHPSSITGYEGPPPSPTSANVTEMWITVPFQIAEAGQTVQSGQLVVTTPPRTTLRIAPF